ncbi:MAG: 2-C-methyl-D-erythritol 4-phosphate cytidylyltransferase [Succinivibrio sp.]|nr:2-C-methyl-D-erythritol 4-phosphate cytidylyltransferase [Succinivibrio sp.]
MLDVIVPAAGSGKRMGQKTPKQYLKLDDRTILEHTLEALLKCPEVGTIIVALASCDHYFETLRLSSCERIRTVTGGKERSDSVCAALELVTTPYVLVHDAARPFLKTDDVERLIARCLEEKACGGILCAASTDTLKLEDKDSLRIEKTLPRAQIFKALTPQLFNTKLLRQALNYVRDKSLLITDDAQALEVLGYHPLLVLGDAHNFKITTPSDLQLARAIIAYQATGADGS